MIWDTGSDDMTIPIIKEIKKRYQEKILFEEIGEVDPEEFTRASQSMLSKTESDWILVLDGDEVWWDDSIKILLKNIERKGGEIETIVQPFYNPIGDIYHYQEDKAGMYRFDEKKGHFAIRALSRKIPGLNYSGAHGKRALYDNEKRPIQKRDPEKRVFLNLPFMHFTNLPRSSERAKDLKVPKRGFKYKYELGKYFPRDFYYPEVFFRKRPSIVPSPWVKITGSYYLKSCFYTPLRFMKRRIMPYGKSGY